MDILDSSLITQNVQKTSDSISIVGFSVDLSQEDIGYAIPVEGTLTQADYDVFVYADTVSIHGDLVNPGRKIEIHARELIIGETTYINCSAPAPTADYPAFQKAISGDGASGSTGTTAGALTIGVDVITVDGPDTGANTAERLATIAAILQSTLGDLAAQGRSGVEQLAALQLSNLSTPMGGAFPTLPVRGASNILSITTSVNSAASPATVTVKLILGRAQVVSQNADTLQFNLLPGETTDFDVFFDLEIDLPFIQGAHGNVLTALHPSFAMTNLSVATRSASPQQLGSQTIMGMVTNILSRALAQHPVVAMTANAVGAALGNAFLPDRTGQGGLCLLAIGGRGGRGQDGADGKIGSGGSAGQDQPQNFVVGPGGDAPAAVTGGRGGPGGKGGDAGPSGNGGSGGRVTVLAGTTPLAVPLTICVSGGSGGAAVLGGQGGPGGPGGPGGSFRREPDISPGAPTLNLTLVTDTGPSEGDGPQGSPGRDLPAGQPGASGTASVNGVASFTTESIPAGSYDAIGLAFPLCQLVLERQGAKLAYLNAGANSGTGAGYQTVAALYNWLLRITEQFTQPGSGTGLDANDVAARAAIAETARLGLSRLAVGLDFFGNPSNWAPALTWKEYDGRVADLQNSYGTFAEQYRIAQAADHSGQIQAAQSAISKMKDNINSSISKSAEIQKEIDQSVALINDLNKKIELQKNCTEQSFGDMENDFNDSLASVGVNLKEIIDIGVNVGRIAGAAASAEANIIGSVQTVAKSGKAVFDDIEGTVDRIETAKAEWSDLAAAWQRLQSDRDSGDNALILTDQEDFDTLIDQSFGTSSSDKLAGTETVKANVKTLLDLAQTRNLAMLNCTALHGRALDVKHSMDADTARIEHLAGVIAAQATPQLPEYESFLQGAMYGVLDDILDTLYQMKQAYSYWAISDYPLELTALDAGHLTQIQDTLKQQIQTSMENGIGGPFSNFTDHAVSITQADQPAAFAVLKDTGQLTVSISPESATCFESMYNVIVETVAVSLDGITPPASGALYLGISQLGPDIRKNPDHTTMVFSHARRDTVFEFDFNAGGGKITVDGTIGDPVQGYSGLSPFTTWLIDFAQPNNSWLDRSTITGVTLTFTGKLLGRSSS